MDVNTSSLKYLAFLNGKIITIDKNDRIVEAVLIVNDKIAAVGSNKEIEELLPRGAVKVDLGGRTVIPGLIDSHVHMELTVNHLTNAVSAHVPGVKNLTDIFNRIKERAAKTPKGEWIIVRGSCYLGAKITEGRMPTKAELDAIAPEHPVVIDNEIHMVVMNTLAIEKMGWHFETWLPPNATLGRDQKTGELNGMYGEVWKFLPYNPWGYDNLLETLRKGAIKHYVSRGITSAHELPYSIDGIRCWQQLKNEGDLPLRLRLYLEHPNLIKLDKLLDLGLTKGFGDEWLCLGGLKLFVDGVGAHANGHPFEDICFTQEELDEVVYKAHAAGLHIWTHVITPTAIRMGIKAYEKALKRLPRKDHRLRLEHMADDLQYWEDAEEMTRKVKELEIVPIGTPQFIHTVFRKNGMQMRSLIDQGFILPGNTDTTGSEPEACDPWHTIWVSVTRKNHFGKVLSPDQCITPLEAIRMNTLWAAWGGFEEQIKGSIEPGKLADIVVLGEDPLTVDPDALKTMPVELVLVGSKVKHVSDKFQGVLD